MVVAGTCGALIGYERTSRQKEAGLKTHFLVAIGSCLIMLVSQHGFSDVNDVKGISLDPSRIAAQVVSGIGFLGAGTIIVQRQAVRGLTTAAGLWTTSGIGLAVGGGMYEIAFGATALVLIALELLSRVTVFVPKTVRLTILVEDNSTGIRGIMEAIERAGIKVSNYHINFIRPSENKHLTIEMMVKKLSCSPVLLADIQSLSSVKSVALNEPS
ncbi:MgtC/SapB family protein [Alicyclobacillus fastidiosus]|uniref:MgtC/SapB family protein n=1 Tax=Alicyclobacillus fastidiosus TaxID=392011 RepID=UPI002DD43488|nr:MgtC/SapB family protein [Alicyclobacillus fastidiosus]